MDRARRGESGALIRHARRRAGLTLAQLGDLTGYSASQVSRFERGLAPLTDIAVLRRFASVLSIPPQTFGLTTRPAPGEAGHERAYTATYGSSAPAAPTVAGKPGWDGEDPVRRRQLLSNLAVTAAAAAGAAIGGSAVGASENTPGDLLIGRVRDAMLGLSPPPAEGSITLLQAELAAALADFSMCRYRRLADRLSRLIITGHTLAAGSDDHAVLALLADAYTLVTRVLIKFEGDGQLGWLAADRAATIAAAADTPLIAAEAARNLAVLARRAGWYAQAMQIALTAADRPELRDGGPEHTAERGLLIQSASYSAAKRGDGAAMRELTDEAAAIAASLGDRNLLRDYGGGFSLATVGLHRISAEYSLGDAGAALGAARRISPARLPTVERRARYFADVAQAFGQLGRRSQAIDALLAAERQAPEEIHSRPATRGLISGLLVSGRTTAELRGLAARCGLA
jgi:transcriptional regulator with XRE-family HTH domain